MHTLADRCRSKRFVPCLLFPTVDLLLHTMVLIDVWYG